MNFLKRLLLLSVFLGSLSICTADPQAAQLTDSTMMAKSFEHPEQHWLNATNVSALTTIALVFLTAWYVVLTRKLVRATLKTHDPVVVFDMIVRNHYYILRVENIGLGIARKVKLKIVDDDDAFSKSEGLRNPLSTIDIVEKGFTQLLPGQRFEYFLGGVSASNATQSLSVVFTAVYENSEGEKLSSSIMMDMRQYLSAIPNRDDDQNLVTAIRDVERTLKGIQDALKKGKGFSSRF